MQLINIYLHSCCSFIPGTVAEHMLPGWNIKSLKTRNNGVGQSNDLLDQYQYNYNMTEWVIASWCQQPGFPSRRGLWGYCGDSLLQLIDAVLQHPPTKVIAMCIYIYINVCISIKMSHVMTKLLSMQLHQIYHVMTKFLCIYMY